MLGAGLWRRQARAMKAGGHRRAGRDRGGRDREARAALVRGLTEVRKEEMRDGKSQRTSSVPGDPAATAWERGYGVIRHQTETRVRIADMLARIRRNGDGVPPSALLSALDRLTSAAMWLVVHQTYARNVYLDGRPLDARDFKTRPEGHTGGALNMVPAYTGYLAANALTGLTRSWLMGQGHCVAAIDAVNVLTGNMTPAHAARYGVSDEGLTRYVRDFYSYRLRDDGQQDSPLMAESMLGELSHVSRVLYPTDFNTAAAVMAEVYRTHGQIWTIVVPKADVAELLSPDEARRAVTDGGIGSSGQDCGERARSCFWWPSGPTSWSRRSPPLAVSASDPSLIASSCSSSRGVSGERVPRASKPTRRHRRHERGSSPSAVARWSWPATRGRSP
jgi:hypothetical protein